MKGLVMRSTGSWYEVLDENKHTETSLLILPNSFEIFTTYLDIVEKAETLLEKEG